MPITTNKTLSESREIRVFLSSTFKDMNAERDYLLAHVFPVLRKMCKERDVSFTEIDLRWGVTEEESKNGQTVEVCLEEIDRCRHCPPFFIGFLGERYGWIPRTNDLEQYWKTHSECLYAAKIREGLEKGISVTELEMQYGFLENPEQKDHARFFFRSRSLTDTFIKEGSNVDFIDGTDKLNSLKERLRQQSVVAIDGYKGLEEFGQSVRQFLEEQIDALYPIEEAPSREEMLERAQFNYAVSRRKAYVPLDGLREELQTELSNILDGNGGGSIILLQGESGLGKSAFLSDLQTWLPAQSDVWLHTHYIGVAGNRSLDDWRDRLLARLEAAGYLTTPIPMVDEAPSANKQDRWDALSIALLETQRSLNKPIVLLLDALDQLTNPKEVLEKLTQLILPRGICLIATATPDISVLAPNWKILTLQPLDEALRRTAITAFLKDYHKELEPSLIEQVAKHSACEVPLYLRMVLEELRMHGTFETLPQKVDELLINPDAAALFKHVLQGMDQDYTDERHQELASRSAQVMVASWRGLRHTDLVKLLAHNTDQKDPSDNKPKISDKLISPLLARLEPFCLQDGGRITMMHRLLQEALKQDDFITEARQKLVSYFNGDSSEAIVERLYQFWQLGENDAVLNILGDLDNVLTVRNAEPQLLSDILSGLGAGLTKANKDIQRLIKKWHEGLEAASTTHVDRVNTLCVWFIELAYMLLAEPLSKQVLERRQQVLPAGHPDIAVSLNNRATVYQHQGRFKEALELMLQILNGCYPDEEKAKIYCNLTVLYNNMGQPKEAAKQGKEALVFYEKNKPSDHIVIATIRNNLGLAYRDMGRWRDAKSQLKRALEMRQQILPPNHLSIATTQSNLATVYKAEGRLEEVELLYKKVLSLYKQELRADHPRIATTMYNLADLYMDQGQVEEAEPLFQQALKIRRRALQPNHPDISLSLNRLAELYYNQRQLGKAEILFEEALGIREKSELPIVLDIARTLVNLASTYRDNNKPGRAEPLFKRAIEIYKNESAHILTILSLDKLSIMYDQQDRFEESVSVLKQAWGVCHDYLQVNEMNTTMIFNNLFRLYIDQGQLKEAELLFKEMQKMGVEQSLPVSNSDVIEILNDLAGRYVEQGQPNAAESLYKELLEFRRQALPDDLEGISISLNDLAGLYKMMGRLKEAEPLFIQALENFEEVLPASHMNFVVCLKNLGEVYLSQGRSDEAYVLFKTAKAIQNDFEPV